MTREQEILELRITRLAGLGDGVAEHGGLPVFVPLAAPGDHLRVAVERRDRSAIRARMVEMLAPSPQRQAPPCPRFGRCGGCQLQHLAPDAYADFKQSLAAELFRQLDDGAGELLPLFQSGAGSRRRAEFKLQVEKGVVTLGFLAARSHDIVSAEGCRVVDAAITEAIPRWQQALSSLKKPSLFRALHLTHADNGMEALLHVEGKPKPADYERLRQFALEEGLLRLGLRDGTGQEQWLLAGEAKLRLGEVMVDIPPAAFLQATKASQDIMIAQVLAGCAGHAHVADLYSGCGTFSLPLAQAGHRVAAYEGLGEAATALFNAARSHGLEDRLTSQPRDLFAAPLSASELARYDAVVINPPRNGALPQCRAIATSGVKRVVMVSCNPATFLRDAQALLAGGYRLLSLLPVDQFTWSHHLELVGIFRCGAEKTGAEP